MSPRLRVPVLLALLVVLAAGLLAMGISAARAATVPPSPSPVPTPQLTSCPGRTKVVSAPGMATPEVLCEQAPGQWVPLTRFGHLPPPTPASDSACGVLDLACMAKEAVTGWFRDLVESARRPVFRLLSATIFGTPEIDSAEMRRPREVWGTSRVIANTCFVLLVTLAGVLLMAGQSLPGELTVKDLLPRVVLAFLAVNLSLPLIGYGISFANGLARAFLADGGRQIDPAAAADTLANGIKASIQTVGAFFVLLALVAIILAVIVGFIYIVRLAITMVLIAAAPLALMFHALPQTEGLAKLWWRAITGMLAIQVCQSLVFVTALRVLFSRPEHSAAFAGMPATKADAIDLLLIICLLWMMIRIPAWVARTIWRNAQPRMLGQLIKTFLIYRTVGTALGAVGRTVRSGRRGRGGRAGCGPGGSGSGGFGGPGGGPGGPGGGGPGLLGGGPHGGRPRHTPGRHPYGPAGHGGHHHGRPAGGYHTGYGPRPRAAPTQQPPGANGSSPSAPPAASPRTPRISQVSAPRPASRRGVDNTPPRPRAQAVTVKVPITRRVVLRTGQVMSRLRAAGGANRLGTAVRLEPVRRAKPPRTTKERR
ncbi:hypothetical protein [Thermoactinospora rubra]|uniref:hypothetical protein n=1 Tax=Thermoactinospora rubra TaxID=1088767 RepID=UPI00130205DA|nr:hypothetical protein [Thermoactinospora rubra]